MRKIAITRPIGVVTRANGETNPPPTACSCIAPGKPHFFPVRQPTKQSFIYRQILGELKRMEFLLCRRNWKIIAAKSTRTSCSDVQSTNAKSTWWRCAAREWQEKMISARRCAMTEKHFRFREIVRSQLATRAARKRWSRCEQRYVNTKHIHRSNKWRRQNERTHSTSLLHANLMFNSLCVQCAANHNISSNSTSVPGSVLHVEVEDMLWLADLYLNLIIFPATGDRTVSCVYVKQYSINFDARQEPFDRKLRRRLACNRDPTTTSSLHVWRGIRQSQIVDSVDGVVPMTLSFIPILDVDGTLMCATVVEYVVGI